MTALGAIQGGGGETGPDPLAPPRVPEPAGTAATRDTLGLKAGEKSTKAKKAEKQPWLKSPAAHAQAVRAVLAGRPNPATAAEVVGAFKGAKAERVAELPATLAALGQARPVDGERFVG
jgi:hypothetical protein